MNSLTDSQLLRDYAERRSETAFAELVRRHVDLVYSAALRMVCDSHLAEDVTQGAFLALARSAHQLTEHAVLSGWLHRTAQNLAAQTVRTDVRRRAREQEAAAMNELLTHESTAAWEHIAPHLDAALGELSESDRDALLLRYFERKSAHEMAQTLGISDEAAQKRVNRAVERLREFFAERGVTVGASGLVVIVTTNAVQAAPVGLAITISTTAALTGTTLVTATKAIAMTTLQKTLIAASLVAAVGTGIYEARQASSLRNEIQMLRTQELPPVTEAGSNQQQNRDETPLKSDEELRGRNDAQIARLLAENLELRKIRDEANELRLQTAELRDKTNQLWQSLVGYINNYSNSIAPDKRWAYSLEERKRYSLAQAEDGRYLLRRKGDEGTDRAIFGGEFTSIGIGLNHIFVHMPAYKDEPEGWRTIDLRSGAVNGTYRDAEFMERPEVRGIRFMKPEEAWELMK